MIIDKLLIIYLCVYIMIINHIVYFSYDDIKTLIIIQEVFINNKIINFSIFSHMHHIRLNSFTQLFNSFSAAILCTISIICRYLSQKDPQLWYENGNCDENV